MPASHVTHEVLADHAQNKVNIPADQAAKRRGQVNYLRAGLEAHIAAHPGYALVKLRASGSTAKHTAIRRRGGEGSDADVAVYVRAVSVGGVEAEEAGLLEWLRVQCRYLRTVDYGFRDGISNAWKLRLRYTATAGGQLLDSRPGSLPTTAAVAGCGFYSYLTYSAAFHDLSAVRRAAVLDRLPVHRVGADEPDAGAGSFLAGHGYARNGVGVTRDIYIAS